VFKWEGSNLKLAFFLDKISTKPLISIGFIKVPSRVVSVAQLSKANSSQVTGNSVSLMTLFF
jgi:hypothetical protein